MAKSDLMLAIEQVCQEKNIPVEAVLETIEAALAVAYRKEFGNKLSNIKVEFDPETGNSKIFDVKTVVEDPTPEELEAAKGELEKEVRHDRTMGMATPRGSAEVVAEGEEEKKRFNPKTDMPVSEAKQIKPDAVMGDEIVQELETPPGYGRVAAQTAKQVIIQKLREAERETLYNQYKDKAGEIIPATVQRVEGKMVFVDLGQAVALMPPSEQVRGEQYRPGQRIKVFLLSIEKTTKGPEILASRAHPDMVKSLFEQEVPEIKTGAIAVMGVAREAGSRTKFAVKSTQENIDPIGSCVGQRGARVQTVISELGGEKIDIIEYSDDPVKYIMNSMSPAKIISVKLDEETKEAKVEVAPDQLSLAIGRGGQNVRLASKLTGWKIDVLRPEGMEVPGETPVEGAAVEGEPAAPAEEPVKEEEAKEEPKAE